MREPKKKKKREGLKGVRTICRHGGKGRSQNAAGDHLVDTKFKQ